MVFDIKDAEEALNVLQYIVEKDYTYIIGNTLDEAILTRETIEKLDYLLYRHYLDGGIINEFPNYSKQEQDIIKNYIIEHVVENGLQVDYHSIITSSIIYYLSKYFREHPLQKEREE